MAPITKFKRKIESILWEEECQKAWELINIYIYWSIDFNISEVGCGVPCSHKCIIVGVGVLLAQNVTRKNDQPVVYASRLFNSAKQNYNTTKQEALTIVFAFHMFKHDRLGNKFVFYVDHMGLVCLVN